MEGDVPVIPDVMDALGVPHNYPVGVDDKDL
jgi:hypothetical protein